MITYSIAIDKLYVVILNSDNVLTNSFHFKYYYNLESFLLYKSKILSV